MPAFEPVVVMTTTPDMPTAQSIADRLLALRLCACVNILPGAQSHFFWQGVFETSSECVCFIKTGRHLLPQIEEAIRSAHPYQVPEVIALPVVWGNADFLKWVGDSIA